ncbi:isoprenylcysteine carboxylmethyltransferase family protein [uncultured Algimonas sp.]|uniref:isoprenylcysteine carboxyl methyltransferase family protein n=1 Tax=uncultured Algimonas sp. TaxID=1547920 RepID=UPI00262A6539|nr:isoprenylcysteine carboxylmethyltransferase family protein [uncultured Algimonas sp.]
MSLFAILFLAYVVFERLVELPIATRNTKRLIAQGGVEHSPRHYPLIVAVHAGWILAMVWWGHDNPLNMIWLGVYAVLQVLRVYILGTLGRRWTTRIIVLPDEAKVTKGPFALVPHPNYLLVICEILVAPLVLGLWEVAAIFGALNAMILVIRVSAEERAWASRSTGSE